MPDLRGLCAEASEAVKGADVLTVVTLSFLEAALGKKHSLQVSQTQAPSSLLKTDRSPSCMGV